MADKGGDWQTATARTIERIQEVFGLVDDRKSDGLDFADKMRLFELAQSAVHFQFSARGGNVGVTEYWNTFVNTLRTLVAGSSDCDPDDVFKDSDK